MRIFASDKVKAEMTEEQQIELVEFFLENAGDDLEFVPESWLKTRGDDAKPVYTIAHKDGKRVMIIWPMQDEQGNYIHLTWQTECPWLDGLHEYGPGDYGPNEEERST